jgi:hypothetical protein
MFSSFKKCSGIFLLLVMLLAIFSCARDQQLVQINVQPSEEIFGASDIPVSENAGSNVQLKAIGAYIHPPVNKDVTTVAVWDSNTPDIATVDAAGKLTATGSACGNSLVSATIRTDRSIGGRDSSGAIIVGHMTATVVCFSPAAITPVRVNFAGTKRGTITSSVPGLGCAGTCSAKFAPGTTLQLKAKPDASFGGWEGCDSVSESGTVCTINDLTSDRELTVTFN